MDGRMRRTGDDPDNFVLVEEGRAENVYESQLEWQKEGF